jgi:hypothetical protein
MLEIDPCDLFFLEEEAKSTFLRNIKLSSKKDEVINRFNSLRVSEAWLGLKTLKTRDRGRS